MDVASARSISSHPSYYGKPICSSQSSLIRVNFRFIWIFLLFIDWFAFRFWENDGT